MDSEQLLRGIQPLPGNLIPIKTVQESRAPEEYADAYVAEVNVKCGSKVNKTLDATFPRDPSQPLNHLRRFAKYPQLPESLRTTLVPSGTPSPHTIFVLIPPPLPEKETLQRLLAPFAPVPPPPATDDDANNTNPITTTTTQKEEDIITLHTVTIPTQPPLSQSQADKWTKSLWPVTFNPAAPRASIAPPLQVLNRVHEYLRPRAGRYLALAQKVAEEAGQSGRGRGVGAVVVDPEIEARIEGSASTSMSDGDGRDWTEAVVAVAGDARYTRPEGGYTDSDGVSGPGPNPHAAVYDADAEGGPELHALMRAVELVACQRRGDAPVGLSPLEDWFITRTRADGVVDDAADELTGSATQSDVPEKYLKMEDGGAAPRQTDGARRIRSRSEGGYLCTDLDVYLSREPCLCCSMGMLLSRFRAVVFPRRGRMVTGGLASAPVVAPVPGEEGDGENDDENMVEEPGQPDRGYYGLHWRKELNWRALGFEFIEDADPEDATGQAERAYDEVSYHA